ncbi:MAG: hypothetical protein AB9844_09355 [Clostridiaceae bacterium]
MASVKDHQIIDDKLKMLCEFIEGIEIRIGMWGFALTKLKCFRITKSLHNMKRK